MLPRTLAGDSTEEFESHSGVGISDRRRSAWNSESYINGELMAKRAALKRKLQAVKPIGSEMDGGLVSPSACVIVMAVSISDVEVRDMDFCGISVE